MNYDLEVMEVVLEKLQAGVEFPTHTLEAIHYNLAQEKKELKNIDDIFYKRIVRDLYDECSKALQK